MSYQRATELVFPTSVETSVLLESRPSLSIKALWETVMRAIYLGNWDWKCLIPWEAENLRETV